MTKLRDLVDMTFGFAFKSAEFTGDASDVRLLRGDNIAQGRLRWDGVKRFPADRVPEVERYLLQAGDVVVAMDRPWIEAGLKFSVVRPADVPSLLVQRVARLRARAGLEQGYLAALIGSRDFMNYVVGTQTGSAVPHISGGQIGDYDIGALPTIEAQRAIASTLGALDERIASNQRVVALALELLDAVAARIAAELPTVALSAVAHLEKDTANPAALGADIVDHYSLPAFDSGALPERVPASTIMSNKHRLTAPTILVSRLNPRTNRTWWVTPKPNHVALASTEFAALGASNGTPLAAIWLAVRDSYFRDEIARRVTGTSGSHQRVRPDDMLSIEVPDVRELGTGVADDALAVMKLVEARRQESERLSDTRDALRPELLSGRVRVSETQEAVV